MDVPRQVIKIAPKNLQREHFDMIARQIFGVDAIPMFDHLDDTPEVLTAGSRSGFDCGRVFLRPTRHPTFCVRIRNVVLRDLAVGVIGTAYGDNVDVRPRLVAERYGLALSLIHISEPTRQAEISYAVFCL